MNVAKCQIAQQVPSMAEAKADSMGVAVAEAKVEVAEVVGQPVTKSELLSQVYSVQVLLRKLTTFCLTTVQPSYGTR
jgi:hypothetical protein